MFPRHLRVDEVVFSVVTFDDAGAPIKKLIVVEKVFLGDALHCGGEVEVIGVFTLRK